MVRQRRASCGKVVHGKEPAAAGELRRCFACDRPGSRDGCSTNWQHVVDSEYWAELGEWSATVGEGWTHERDLVGDPLKAGECICRRADCVVNLYQRYKGRRQREEKGALHTMVIGQRSPMGR
ncbi:unnamed protein product [Ectocarpus sp. CCAP 1310/34]|nr:unnamed protein product [Ectocarpus sp. CCAP 1310/34]CAB1098362.1 unnamed protein product [Ectocarpus sp. CCAP 1310/34]CAB1098677.1 unnamed protein product [Ectocarpus sp. CCAP 1310/34]CAB1112415.1 unnamed protein product [Ectocarpus sp. CCAP 1310/34]CAB1112710.1 unnamed protein product [Ectocarpus sp. CCAP 1310/34]